MWWIVGLVLLAAAIKIAWIVLVFAAPVLVPLVVIGGGLMVLGYAYQLVGDVLSGALDERNYQKRLKRQAEIDAAKLDT